MADRPGRPRARRIAGKVLRYLLLTVLAFFLTRYGWGWSLGKSLAVTAFFLVPELAFVSANVAKIAHGGWFPLTMGVILCGTMLTWKRGREILSRLAAAKLFVECPTMLQSYDRTLLHDDGDFCADPHVWMRNSGPTEATVCQSKCRQEPRAPAERP